MNSKEYLSTLTEQIRCKKAREPIRLEILSHIEEQKQAFQREGMNPEDAEHAAVLEMGDPVEAGGALDRIHRPKMAWGLILLIGVLSLLSLLAQTILEYHFTKSTSLPFHFGKQLTLLLINFLVMIGVCYVDYSRIGQYAKPITLLLFASLMIISRIPGVTINGSYWISFLNIHLNFGVFILLFVPLYSGILYSYRGKNLQVIFFCLVWMLPGILIGAKNSNPLPIILLYLSLIIILSIAIYRDWFHISKKIMLPIIWILTGTLPFLTHWIIMHFARPYQQERLRQIFNHTKDDNITKLLTSLLRGSKMLGRGQGNSQVQGSLLSDYTLTYIFSYYGILVGIVLIGLIAYLFMRFYHISLTQKNQIGMLMGIGYSTILFLQFALYVMGNLHFMTFFSSCLFFNNNCIQGIVTFILFGLLLSIYRYENVLPEKQVKTKELFKTIPQ